VTTVIPSIGRDTLRSRTIPSLLGQTVTDWRCIIVGDGVDIPAFDDERITVLRIEEPDYPDSRRGRWRIAGVEALCHGLDHVETEWWSYLADDDAYAPIHHERLLEHAHHADCIYGRTRYHTGDETPPPPHVPNLPPESMDVCQGAYIVRTSIAPRPTTALDRGKEGWDAYWWSRFAPETRYARVPDVVCHYHPAREGYGYPWPWRSS
jgi:hypothetical protein